MANRHLQALENLLQSQPDAGIFACIHDLAANGLDQKRFDQEERLPNRQDVTQFLAAWSLLTGLSQEQCSAWLAEYCVDVLSAISRSSPSQIRHSTKSNIKFIYQQAKKFVCHGPHNIFNENGYKTRTGRAWTYQILRTRLKELDMPAAGDEQRAERLD